MDKGSRGDWREIKIALHSDVMHHAPSPHFGMTVLKELMLSDDVEYMHLYG